MVFLIKGVADPHPHRDDGTLDVEVLFKIEKGTLVIENPDFITGLESYATLHINGNLSVGPRENKKRKY